MGNKQEGSKAVINITLDNSIYLPGEYISGKIEIFYKEQIYTDKIQNPKINLSILQHKHWQSSFYSEDDQSILKGVSNINFFSEIENNFSQFGQNNTFQGFKLSFIYIIPNEITPSLEWPNKKTEYSFIRNYLYVQIPELNAEKKVLIIIQKLPDKVQRLLKIAKEEKNIWMEASYPQSSFSALSHIPISVFLNSSESEMKIKEVIVSLNRVLEFKYKNSDKVYKKILQVMCKEKREIKENNNIENFLVNIPFKDGKDITFNFSKSIYGIKDEVSCLLPNVNTNIINVSYYVKIMAVPYGFFNKNIELKLTVDFYSKDKNNLNENIFNNFDKTVVKINNGKLPIENDGIYSNSKNNFNSAFNLNEIDLNKNAVFIKKNSQDSFNNRKNIIPELNINNINGINNINNIAKNNMNQINNMGINNFHCMNSINNMNNINLSNMNNMNINIPNNFGNMNMNNMNINKSNNINMNNMNINNMKNMSMNYLNNINNFGNKNMNINLNNINMNKTNIIDLNNIYNVNMNYFNNNNNFRKLNMNNTNNLNINLNNMNNSSMNNLNNISFVNNINNFGNMNMNNTNNMNIINLNNMNNINNNNMNNFISMNNMINTNNLNLMNNSNNFGNMNFSFGGSSLPSFSEVLRGHNLVYMNNNFNNNNITNLNYQGF